ncbi:MAG TPA: helix-turn-helix domain-containing protein [Solirubrobacterales bacterium]|nr:helix-turn-helix domain-containing protein [Solirubrobacterales bacterium]
MQTVLARLHGMEEDSPVRDAEYLDSLAEAVHEGVRYGIEVLAVGEDRAGEVPLAVIVQARHAARHRIPLETAQRRYMAAHLQLNRFALEEAEALPAGDPVGLATAMEALAAVFERLLVSAAKEYEHDARARAGSHEARLVERVRRLLAGEMVDPSLLEYELGGHHLGLVAHSAETRPLVRRLAGKLGHRSLILTPSSEELWAWLGSTRGPIDAGKVRDWLASEGDSSMPIGMGEPKSGRDGWRLTHQQARASLWIAAAKSAPVVEYTGAALSAALGSDVLLTTSLREKYLLPLDNAKVGGEVLRATLRAYFGADRNSSCAAAALGISRQTVTNRIQTAERCIGLPLSECQYALVAALSLEELGCIPPPPNSLP